jgi:large subunit ribosomal protein L1
VPNQGLTNKSLPRRPQSNRTAIFPPPIPHFLTPRRRPIRQRSKIQAQRPANNIQQEEEEGLHKLLHPGPPRCSAIQPGGRYAVRQIPGAIFSIAPQCPNIVFHRYLRAAEVGRIPTSSKYELHVRFKTPKNGAVVRNRMRLPHPVKTDLRICVIAPEDSAAGKAAKAAGASLVGEDHVFDMIKDGRIEFDRCLCHVDSLAKLSKSGVARILGPRGLMPSAKTNSVVKDVSNSVKDMVGASEYRERMGVVRMSIGQLGFTPEEVQRNIKAFIDALKKDMAGLADRISKEIHEVVLSSTNGPGMSLNGDLRSPGSPPTKDLSTM